MGKTLLLAAAMLAALPISAQDGLQRKVSSATTSNIAEDGSKAKTQSQAFFYDSKNNEAFNFTYNASGDRTDYSFKTFDSDGRIIADSTQLQKLYYFYDAQGRKVKEEKWTNYNNPAWPDTKQDSTLYYYDGNSNRIDHIQYGDYAGSKDVFFYNGKGQKEKVEHYGIDYSDGYKYQVISRTYYAYDETGNMVSSDEHGVSAGIEDENGRRSSFFYDGNNMLVRDTINAAYSTTAHAYSYDADGNILLTENYDYDSTKGSWALASQIDYSYGQYGKMRTVANLIANVDANEPTTVRLTFDGPTDNNGLDGFMVFKDGALEDSVYKSNDGSLSFELQARGIHTYQLLPVYGGVTANISNVSKALVEVELPSVKNIRLTEKEYKGDDNYGQWSIKAVWDAPVRSKYKLVGYRWAVGTYSGTASLEDPSLSYNDSGYGSKTPTIKVYAVYNVGESDADSLQFSIEDKNDQITAHYNNYMSVVKDADGNTLQTKRYLYTPKNDVYNPGEELYAIVSYDELGIPAYRTNADGSETRQWNKNSFGWDDYKKTETLKKSNGADSVVVEYSFEGGKWNVERKTFAHYNNASNEWEASDFDVYTYEGNDSTFEKRIHRYNAKDGYGNITLQVDSIYDERDGLVGKTERTFFRWNVIKDAADYEFAGGKFLPVSRTTNTFDERGLQLSSIAENYEGGKWKTMSEEAFSSSKEYSLTHTPSSDGLMLDGDGDIVVWNAPARTDGLTGYRVYVNDVEYGETNETKFSFVGAKIPKGLYNVRVMALYNSNESCVSDEIEVEVITTATSIESAMDASGVELGKAVKVVVYDDAGRVVANTTGNMLSQVLNSVKGRRVLVVHAVLGDGSRKSVKVVR